MAGVGPQVVQVLDFATARAPELQALHELAHNASVHSVVDEKLTTQRNQRRRRANAFKSHQLPRRLRLQRAAQDKQEEEELITLGTMVHGHLQKAPAVFDMAAKTRAKKDQRPRCRKHRRRMHLLVHEHSWLDGDANDAPTGNDDQQVEDDAGLQAPKWLATHAWHAKRMRMTERYGHVLAQRRQDKSVSAALTALRTNATLHDASYYGVIELYGSVALIQEALELVCDPLQANFYDHAFLSGQQQGHSTLFQVNEFPTGAISPVTFMWRPLQADYGQPLELDQEPLSTKRQLWLWIHPAAFMEAASAIASACQEIMSEREQDERIEIVDRRGHVARLQLRGKRANRMLQQVLIKLESDDASAMDTRDDDGDAANSDHDDHFDFATVRSLTSKVNLDAFQRELLLLHRPRTTQDVFPTANIHSVLVQDPRLRSTSPHQPANLGVSLLDEPDSSLVSAQEDILCPLTGVSLLASASCEEPDSELILAQLESLLKWTTTPSPATIDGPVQINDTYPYVAAKPHAVGSATQQRLASDAAMAEENVDGKAATSIPCSLLWSACGRRSVREAFQKDHEMNRQSVATRRRRQKSSGVPVLLIRHDSVFPDTSGWDLVLSPLHTPGFLNALVFAGAMVIGLDEQEALATVNHEPSFPRDFPDTPAGHEYWERLANECENEYVKKPTAKQVAYGKLGVDSPFQPNWDALFATVDKNAHEVTEQPQAEKDPDAPEDEAMEGGEEEEEEEESSSLCVLRGMSYMEPFPFSRLIAGNGKPKKCESPQQQQQPEQQELIPLAMPTLIRVALSFPRRGTLEPCSMLYLPTESDMASFHSDPKWSGCQFDTTASGDQQLELLGFVTSAVYDRPKSAFRGTAFCGCEQLQRLVLERGDAAKTQQLIALTRTPSSRQLRPVLVHIQA